VLLFIFSFNVSRHERQWFEMKLKNLKKKPSKETGAWLSSTARFSFYKNWKQEKKKIV